jgi:hypothetical protein
MTAITRSQIAAIHAEAKRLGLDEASRRDLIAAHGGGKRSSKDLSYGEAVRVIAALKDVSRGMPEASAPPRAWPTLSGRYVPIARALWIAGYNLGVIRDRTDAAMIAWVRRQTGIDHVSWVGPDDGGRIVDALKQWISRETGVYWPAKTTDPRLRKRAVLVAQHRLLGRRDELAPLSEMSNDDMDALSARLGREIRRAAQRAAGSGQPAAGGREADG